MTAPRQWLRALGLVIVLGGAAALWLDDPAAETPKLVGETQKSIDARRAQRKKARENPAAAPVTAVGAQNHPASESATAAASVRTGSPADEVVIRPGQLAPAELPSDAGQSAADAPGAKAGSAQSPLAVLRDEGLTEDVAGGEVPVPGKVARYAQVLVDNYDDNGDGRLEPNEWSRMRGNPRLADLDRDDMITVDELSARVTAYGVRRTLRLMPATPTPGKTSGAPLVAQLGPFGTVELPAGTVEERRRRRYHVPVNQLPPGLGDWFVDNDADGDSQITMSEFSANLNDTEVQRFMEYDLNADGVITPQEFIGSEVTRRAAEEAANRDRAAAEEATVEAAAAQNAPTAGSASESPTRGPVTP